MNKTIIECHIHTHATIAEIDLSVITLRLHSAAAVTFFRILSIHFQLVFVGDVIKVTPGLVLRIMLWPARKTKPDDRPYPGWKNERLRAGSDTSSLQSKVQTSVQGMAR